MIVTERPFAVPVSKYARSEESPVKQGLVRAELRSALKTMAAKQTYLKGKALFRCGQPPRGVYLVEKGEVNLFLPSTTATGAVFEKAGPGTLLGLSEALSGTHYKLRAEAACPTAVSFVTREALLDCLRRNPVSCMQIVHLLSEDVHLLYHRFRSAPNAGHRKRRRVLRAGTPEDSRLS
jgi:CRP-like cAMP-binding protein